MHVHAPSSSPERPPLRTFLHVVHTFAWKRVQWSGESSLSALTVSVNRVAHGRRVLPLNIGGNTSCTRKSWCDGVARYMD